MPRKKRISRKQLAANRRNALKSTGPRTEQGKQTVGRNALSHGLAGTFAILPAEDRAAWEAFTAEIIRDFAPANATELSLAQSIANEFWRKDRVYALETAIYAPDPAETPAGAQRSRDPDPALTAALAGAQAFLDHSGEFELLAVYERRINRTLHKNLAEVRRLQAQRRQSQHQKREEVTAVRTENQRPANDLQPKTAANGFVCANSLSARNVSGGAMPNAPMQPAPAAALPRSPPLLCGTTCRPTSAG